MPWGLIIIGVIFAIIIILLVVLLLRGKSTSRPVQSMILQDELYDPSVYSDLIDANTFFSDIPDTYSSGPGLTLSLERARNAFLWAVDKKDSAVADKIIAVAWPKFVATIPDQDFSSHTPPEFGKGEAFGTPLRSFYNALWYYKQDAIPDLRLRIQHINEKIGFLNGFNLAQEYVARAVQRAWYLYYIEGTSIADDPQVANIPSSLPSVEMGDVGFGTSNSIMYDGSYMYNNSRDYQLLLDFYNSVRKVNMMVPFIDGHMMDVAFTKLSTFTGLISPALLGPTLVNKGLSSDRLGISIINGVRVFCQSQKNWSWCGWANTNTLRSCDFKGKASFLFYTSLMNISLNTHEEAFKDDEWQLVPGVLFPPHELEVGALGVDGQTGGIGLGDENYAFISDVVHDLPKVLEMERHILITPNGLKCCWRPLTMLEPCTHTLYTGKTIKETKGGWVVDNSVFVSVQNPAGYGISTESGYQVIRAKYSEITPITFNITYGYMDSNFLVINTDNYNYIWTDGTVTAVASGLVCAMKYDNTLFASIVYHRTPRSISVTNGLVCTLDKVEEPASFDGNLVVSPEPIIKGQGEIILPKIDTSSIRSRKRYGLID